MNWKEQKEEMLGVHPYTRDDQIPNRCMEGVFMTMLLEQGSFVICYL